MTILIVEVLDVVILVAQYDSMLLQHSIKLISWDLFLASLPFQNLTLFLDDVFDVRLVLPLHSFVEANEEPLHLNKLRHLHLEPPYEPRDLQLPAIRRHVLGCGGQLLFELSIHDFLVIYIFLEDGGKSIKQVFKGDFAPVVSLLTGSIVYSLHQLDQPNTVQLENQADLTVVVGLLAFGSRHFAELKALFDTQS